MFNKYIGIVNDENIGTLIDENKRDTDIILGEYQDFITRDREDFKAEIEQKENERVNELEEIISDLESEIKDLESERDNLENENESLTNELESRPKIPDKMPADLKKKQIADIVKENPRVHVVTVPPPVPPGPPVRTLTAFEKAIGV